jgi:ribonuclease P protein component
MTDQRFRKKNRLRKPADYERVFQRKCSARGEFIAIHACENHLGRIRLGRIVSKKWGNAVLRNRLRRWLREAVRQAKPALPTGTDFVIVPRKLQGVSLRLLAQELPCLAKKVVELLQARP